MGMAASQARLLTLTARIHDVEYKAQSLQNAKLQLATQSDEVYNEYLAALDATTLTIKDADSNLVTANFTNMCGPNAILLTNNARTALFDNKGRLIVEDDIYNAYQKFAATNVDDPYLFANWMLNANALGNNPDEIDENTHSDIIAVEKEIIEEDPELLRLQESLNAIIKEVNDKLEENECGSYKINIETVNATADPFKPILDAYKAKADYLTNPLVIFVQSAKERYDSTNELLRYKLYNKNSKDIYGNAMDEIGYDENLFNYYVNIYKQIQANGGSCINISKFNGMLDNSDAATDSDWLQAQIKAGQITLDRATMDTKTGRVTLSSTSPSTDTNISFTTTTTIDKVALAKAEAQYTKATKDIDKKEKRYDLELSKLETERSALTKQYEATKKVIDDNIQRTFGIFGG